MHKEEYNQQSNALWVQLRCQPIVQEHCGEQEYMYLSSTKQKQALAVWIDVCTTVLEDT